MANSNFCSIFLDLKYTHVCVLIFCVYKYVYLYMTRVYSYLFHNCKIFPFLDL